MRAAIVVVAIATAAPVASTAAGMAHRVVPRAEIPALLAAADPATLRVLERVNRADRAHLGRLDALIVPSDRDDDPLAHAPFPPGYPAAGSLPKLLVVDLAWQAFAGYEHGRLLRWGPVSSGRRAAPTPTGAFHLTWKSLGRHSTVNPRWYMPWYFNFENRRGLALHAYTLPGRPASHACIRMLDDDARWLYGWGEQWTLGAGGGTIDRPGTPVLIHDVYDYDAPPPWRSAERLAVGATLPAALPFLVPHALGATLRTSATSGAARTP